VREFVTLIWRLHGDPPELGPVMVDVSGVMSGWTLFRTVRLPTFSRRRQGRLSITGYSNKMIAPKKVYLFC